MNKTSGKLILLSVNAPKSKVEVDGFTITAYKRALIKHSAGVTIEYDSIIVEYENKTNDELKNWVLFYSFVMDSDRTLSSFEGTINGVIEYKDDPCNNPCDYNNILGQVYFLHEPKNASMSYEDFYKKFQQADSSTINATKNMLARFTPTHYNPLNRVVDNSYWQLLAYYSVVDMIVDRQKPCCYLKCNKCHNSDPHGAMLASDWLSHRINEIVDNEETAKQYIDYIWAVYNSVRNNTVHSSLHPTAQYVIQEEEHVIYDVKKALGDYETDSTALSALVYIMGKIARYLLLGRLFDLGVYPEISPLKSSRIMR